MKRFIASSFLFLIACYSAYSQNYKLEQPEHLLDGYSFNYQYQTGSAIFIEFNSGKLTYQWIAGPSQGNPAKTHAYQSRLIAEDIFLVNWHEEDEKNFITLVFNLKNRVASSSVIVSYGDADAYVAFQGGIIEHLVKN